MALAAHAASQGGPKKNRGVNAQLARAAKTPHRPEYAACSALRLLLPSTQAACRVLAPMTADVAALLSAAAAQPTLLALCRRTLWTTRSSNATSSRNRSWRKADIATSRTSSATARPTVPPTNAPEIQAIAARRDALGSDTVWCIDPPLYRKVFPHIFSQLREVPTRERYPKKAWSTASTGRTQCDLHALVGYFGRHEPRRFQPPDYLWVIDWDVVWTGNLHRILRASTDAPTCSPSTR